MPITDSQLNSLKAYVCPTCKHRLRLTEKKLECMDCQVTYPIINGIPDFILEDLTQSKTPVLREVRKIDRLSRIYETKLWYPLVLNLYGGLGAPGLKTLVRIIEEMIESHKGVILDIACGPGTMGRRIASVSRTVYGIDISMGMLQRGLSYSKQENIPNIYFARARAEAIPFPDLMFDASICSGALHLFADTLVVLKEISRVMKEGASLAIMTFIAGKKGILRFSKICEHLKDKHGIHVFKVPELEHYLNETGFELVRKEVYGSILVFSAQKRKK